MDIYEHEVRRDKWCSSCKHYKESEFDPESECYECMFDIKNEASRKPTHYNPAENS